MASSSTIELAAAEVRRALASYPPFRHAAAGIAVKTSADGIESVSYTHLRAHETVLDLVCRLLLEKNIRY